MNNFLFSLDAKKKYFANVRDCKMQFYIIFIFEYKISLLTQKQILLTIH